MSEFSGSRRQDLPPDKTVRDVWAGGNASVAGKIGTLIIQNVQRAQKDALPPLPGPPPIQPGDPRVRTTRAALAHLRQSGTCIYLDYRYCSMPHAAASGLLNDLRLGVAPLPAGSLAEAMGWLAGQIGPTAAQHHLAQRYSRLDDIDSEVFEALKGVAFLANGRLLVTGIYSARIQNPLGSVLTAVHADRQVDLRLTPGRSERAHLLMLYGSEFLSYSWVVLGAGSTFHLLFRDVCRKLEMQQRPVFFVDPRPGNKVTNEWPQAALRHVALTPAGSARPSVCCGWSTSHRPSRYRWLGRRRRSRYTAKLSPPASTAAATNSRPFRHLFPGGAKRFTRTPLNNSQAVCRIPLTGLSLLSSLFAADQASTDRQAVLSRLSARPAQQNLRPGNSPPKEWQQVGPRNEGSLCESGHINRGLRQTFLREEI